MAEYQNQYDGERGKEFYTVQKVVRLTDSLNRDFRLACARAGLKESTILRLMIMTFNDKINSFPKELRQSAPKEISDTVDKVTGFLPVVKRQMIADPRSV